MRERSRQQKEEEAIKDRLPETFVDEDGNRWMVKTTYRLVRLRGIGIVECSQELADDLITYGLNERCRVALAGIAFAFIRRSYLTRPTSDDVLSARTNAVSDLLLAPIYDAIEEEYQRETNPGAFITRPPRSGEFLVSFFMPREKRNEVIGSLAAYYTDMEAEYGTRVARVLYGKEVVRSVGPILVRSVEWLLKYKVLDTIGEFLGHLRHR